MEVEETITITKQRYESLIETETKVSQYAAFLFMLPGIYPDKMTAFFLVNFYLFGVSFETEVFKAIGFELLRIKKTYLIDSVIESVPKWLIEKKENFLKRMISVFKCLNF